MLRFPALLESEDTLYNHGPSLLVTRDRTEC